MKKAVVSVLGVLAVSSVAWAAGSALLQEFERRDQLKFGPAEGAVLAFLGNMKFAVEGIEELELLDQKGGFLLRDRNDVICIGDVAEKMIRCKNKIGLTTISYQGDAD